MTTTYGELAVMRFNDRPYITQADDLIRISHELVKQCRDGDCKPYMTITDNVVTIVASNKTVVYRLTGVDDNGNHLAERVDK